MAVNNGQVAFLSTPPSWDIKSRESYPQIDFGGGTKKLLEQEIATLSFSTDTWCAQSVIA